MLNRIKAFFDLDLSGEGASESTLSEENIHLACAALLIEVAVIDQHFDEREFQTMQGILQKEYGLNPQECEELTELAKQEQDNASSMYQFTQHVNQLCQYEDKFKLVTSMWKIAYADGSLDKYEEYIIRKTSDLLHVAHNDFIRAKQVAREESFKPAP